MQADDPVVYAAAQEAIDRWNEGIWLVSCQQRLVVKYLVVISRSLKCASFMNELWVYTKCMSQWMKQGMQLVSQHPAVPPVLSRRSHPTMAAHVAALHCTTQVCCRSTSHISELHPQSRTKPLPQPLAADAKPPSNSPQPMSSAPQESHPTLLCESMLKFHEKSRQ